MASSFGGTVRSTPPTHDSGFGVSEHMADQIAVFWQAYGGIIQLLVLVVICIGVFRLAQVVTQRQLLDRDWLEEQLEWRQQMSQRALDGTRQDLVATLARSQVLTQESQQRGISALKDNLDQRMNALQRQSLEDSAGLKTDLVGRFERLRSAIGEELGEGRLTQQRELSTLRQYLDAGLTQHREAMEQRQMDNIRAQQEGLATTMQALSKQVTEAFRVSADELGKRVEGLTRSTDARLKEITGQVEQRLNEGFQKTTETFTKVLEHLTRIDEAQKKITELSTNVVSLQEVLTDKRSRGAFGEVQLSALVGNVMPEGSFEMQSTLSNGTRVDCLLHLPDPSGNVPIDAKFPLESYQKMLDPDQPETERERARRLFRQDIRRHINAIADKYLIPGETAEGAVMFLPAEAIFAEIHARFPELVLDAQRRRVWLVSPTTLMAVLTTARAVLKDDATRRQVHIIQDHLRRLADDFGRFQQRMDNLAKHIAQAHQDVDQVNTSARKISDRFEKIDNVEVEGLENSQDGANRDGLTLPSSCVDAS